MTKIIKYHAAVLTLAVLTLATLAAVLAAPPPPAGAQWAQWDEQDERCRPYPAPGINAAASEVAASGVVAILQELYGLTPRVAWENWEKTNQTRETPLPPHIGHTSFTKEVSFDGGLTWALFDDATKGDDEITNKRRAEAYRIGEFGHYKEHEGYDEGFRTTWTENLAPGECDGPHAGMFQLRDSNAGEYSLDGGLTWATGSTWTAGPPPPGVFTGGTSQFVQGYLYGEHFVDNYDGPDAGMFRYRYTRNSSDPLARLVEYNFYNCRYGEGNPERFGTSVDTLASVPSCFDDVRGGVHAANIMALNGRGISFGCGDGRFCPSRTVNRAQMAAFLHRGASPTFREEGSEILLSDVASDAWYLTDAQWAVANGVMRAPGGIFDPGGAVTRADMAEMLAVVGRAWCCNPGSSSGVSVPDRAQGLFTDTTGLPDATVRAIEGIRAAGITAGCAVEPLRYCPDETVTRAQMASFLVRAFRLW